MTLDRFAFTCPMMSSNLTVFRFFEHADSNVELITLLIQHITWNLPCDKFGG